VATPIRFDQTSVHGALEVLFTQGNQILSTLGALMSRGDEIKAEVETLRAEQQETRDAALAAVQRVRDLVAALQAQVEALVAGQVSDTELAEIKAAAAAVKAEADAVQVELGEVAPPAPEA
jgi:chromosome segregation ATPase